MPTDVWGIEHGYEDAMGSWHETPPATRSAIRAAMHIADEPTSIPPEPRVRVLRPGQTLELAGPAELRLEDGTTLQVSTTLPVDLPTGYHVLFPLVGGQPLSLIVSPGQCYLPAAHLWGWAVQLYALRSAKSWGMGDLADLRRLARWSARTLGAGMLLTNPLHASTPTLPQQPSPYFPSSRRYRNPLYLCVEAIPGATGAGIALEPLIQAGRALNRAQRIDRDAIFRLKMHACEQLWARFHGAPAFEDYQRDQGDALRQFARFCALAERYGPDWHTWPTGLRRPDSAEVARFATAHAERVDFHQWVQWLLDEQMAQAAAELALVQDLPIGVDPNGADAWAWQDVLAANVTVGVPPDEYNTLGQDWGLPPFIPHKLGAVGYEPFRQVIRATLRHAGGLRIDHVMGLFRLYWISQGMDPSRGAFVRYPAEHLLAIVALESQRAGAFVVGEDLGTVEKVAQVQLTAHQVLSYRLLWFETAPPSCYPQQALAAVTTHDLPTIAGLWSGADLQAQQALGLRPNARGLNAIRARLQAMTSLPANAAVPEVIVATHQLLASAPSILVAATLEDAMAVEARPNMPNTTTAWPNWSIPLPMPLESFEISPLAQRIGQSFKGRQLPRDHTDTSSEANEP